MEIYNELSVNLRRPYYHSMLSSGQSTHEGIKAQLYVMGYKLGMLPLLESLVDVGGIRTGRIDCVFLDRPTKDIICAIEVDGSARDNSIEKLLSLPDSVEKIIVSIGTESAWRKMTNRMGSTEGYSGIRFFRLARYKEHYT